MVFRFFFFHADRVTHVYTLSLHDALPICVRRDRGAAPARGTAGNRPAAQAEEQVCSGADDELADADRRGRAIDRKSTRLNSSHRCISYAVFCLKKKIHRNQECSSSIILKK